MLAKARIGLNTRQGAAEGHSHDFNCKFMATASNVILPTVDACSRVRISYMHIHCVASRHDV